MQVIIPVRVSTLHPVQDPEGFPDPLPSGPLRPSEEGLFLELCYEKKKGDRTFINRGKSFLQSDRIYRAVLFCGLATPCIFASLSVHHL